MAAQPGTWIATVISAGCGWFNRSPTVVTQCPISHPGLDGLPILLSSGCEFRACRGSRVGCKDFARDTRATTAVEAAVPDAREIQFRTRYATAVEAAVPAAREIHFARDTRATTVQNKNALSDFFRQGVLRENEVFSKL
jgi:hypothetical protein